jgi:hypothetical protein
MPFDHAIDHAAALVTIRVTTCAAPRDAIAKARELIRDETIDSSYQALILVDQISRDATTEELKELADILKMAGRKYRGRKAIVTAQPGRVAIVRMLALNASTHDDVEAFTTEDAARAWLLAGSSR